MATTRDELNAHIQEYMAIEYEKRKPGESSGLFFADWALVINLGHIEDGYAKEYWIEHFPERMAPHILKGLFAEGHEGATIGFDEDDN